MVEFLLLVVTVPGLVPLVLLARDASNLPLAAVCLIPIGPGVAAALYALHDHRGDLTDLRPSAAFWRGYRINAWPVLRLWIPWLAWLTVLALGLTRFEAAGVPGWWAVLLVLVAAWATLGGINALVITSLFDFRVRDVLRLAQYFLVRTPGVTIGNACLLAVAAFVTVTASEAVLALCGSMLVLMLLLTCRPMIGEVRADFTA